MAQQHDVQLSPSTPSPWSFDLLPPKIVSAFLRRLPSHVDRVRFAAVCRAWHAASTHQPRQPLPWLALPDGTFLSYPAGSTPALRFPYAGARFHGASGDCLLLRGGGDGYMLVHASTGDTTMWLPDLSSVRFVVRGGEWLSWRSITDDKRAPEDTAVRKVIMCPGPGKVVAAMVGDGRRLNKISMCRPDSESWVMSAHDAWRGFTDIAFYDGKVFAVTDAGDLFAMRVDVDDGGTGEPKMSWAKIVIKAAAGGDAPATARHRSKSGAPPAMRYLVVSGGRLLMVHREVPVVVTNDDDASAAATMIRFTVFKADLVSSRWSEVKSVGDDTALFVGRWTSVSRRVSPYGLPGNRIHFLDDDVFCNNGCPAGGQFGSYDLTDGVTHPLLPPLEKLCNGGAGDSPATWFFPWEQEGVLSWCDLPSGLYCLILRRLPCRQDRVNLSEVCRHWLACARQLFPPARIFARAPVVVEKAPEPVVAPPPPVAYLALHNGQVFTYPELATAPASPVADYSAAAAGYICAACDDWLLFKDADGLFRLSSPLTGKTRLLPSLTNVRAHAAAVEIVNEPAPDPELRDWTDYAVMEVRKLVMCPDGFIAAIIGREHYGKVALCSLETFSWSVSVHDRWRWYEDLACCDGKLYAVTACGDLLAFDVGVEGNTGQPFVARVERVVVGASSFGSPKLHYLVPSSSGAGGAAPLMVLRSGWDVSSLERFTVFRADFRWARWVDMDRLGYGEALFVGRLCSRAVRARLRGGDGVRGDQIFFVPDDCVGLSFWEPFWEPRRGSGGLSPHHAMAVYDMVNRRVTDLVALPESHGPMPPVWLFPSSGNDDDATNEIYYKNGGCDLFRS